MRGYSRTPNFLVDLQVTSVTCSLNQDNFVYLTHDFIGMLFYSKKNIFINHK
jgi:hypothetical protein